MNNETMKRTLILVATGLLTATAGASTVSAAQFEQCALQDPDTQPGGEVTMAPVPLANAQHLANGDWLVTVPRFALAGISVPQGMLTVKVRLTPQQYANAVQLAQNGSNGTATFSVHNEEWVDEQEQRLLGGFAVQFVNVAFCDYGGPTWD